MNALQAALVAHWKLNDVSGTTVVDSSGNGYNGTAQRDCSLLTTTGKVNDALAFNGTSDYIDTGNSFQSVFQNSFLVSLWVKHTEGQAADKNIVGTINTSFTGGVNFYTGSNGKINFYYTNGTSYKTIQTGVVLNSGQEIWHHFVAAAGQTSSTVVTLSIYFDNVLKKQTPITNCQMSNYVNTRNLYIGQLNPLTPAEYLNAAIDNITLFSIPGWTADQITNAVAFLWNGGAGTEDLSGYDAGVNVEESWDWSSW